MKHLLLRLLPLTALVLAACNGGTPADQVLMKMHKVFSVGVLEYVRKIEQPLRAQTTTDLQVHISAIPELFPGSADITLQADVRHDVVATSSPLAEAALKFSVEADAAAGTFSGTIPAKNAPRDHLRVSASLLGRSIERTLLLNIANVAVSGPMLPAPFVLPLSMSTEWYGITFDEINRTMEESAKANGQPTPQPVEQIISNAFTGMRIQEPDARELLQELHLWNGIELLPEEGGIVRVRVESDKKKIQTSMRALLRFLEKNSGQPGSLPLDSDPEFKKLKDSVENDAEFQKNVGSAKGIISADKSTHEVRGFDGDIYDASGALVLHVTYAKAAGGDMSLVMTQKTGSGETVAFYRTGEKYSVDINGTPLVKGTISDTAFDFVMTDPEKNVKLTMKGEIAEFKDNWTALHLRNIRIEIPEEKLIALVESYMFSMSEDYRDFDMVMKASGTLDGKPLFSMDLTSVRKKIGAFTLERPVFKPFESLEADFMQVLGGMEVPVE